MSIKNRKKLLDVMGSKVPQNLTTATCDLDLWPLTSWASKLTISHPCPVDPLANLQENRFTVYKILCSPVWPNSASCDLNLWPTNPQSRLLHGKIFDPPPNSIYGRRAFCGWPVSLEFPAGELAESGYWREQGTVSDNLWRRFCLQRTDAFSALEVSWRCAI